MIVAPRSNSPGKLGQMCLMPPTCEFEIKTHRQSCANSDLWHSHGLRKTVSILFALYPREQQKASRKPTVQTSIAKHGKRLCAHKLTSNSDVFFLCKGMDTTNSMNAPAFRVCPRWRLAVGETFRYLSVGVCVCVVVCVGRGRRENGVGGESETFRVYLADAAGWTDFGFILFLFCFFLKKKKTSTDLPKSQQPNKYIEIWRKNGKQPKKRNNTFE